MHSHLNCRFFTPGTQTREKKKILTSEQTQKIILMTLGNNGILNLDQIIEASKLNRKNNF
jgi:hypothetical protein